ncbi:MAG: flippase [Candidatus Zixiibacteriota bacterium]|nr:MAG: flippase [candidate division Zixibacteria bacterium]
MTSTGGKLARNSFWMISVQVFGRALTLLFSLYAASALGVEKFGIYGYAMAIVTLMAAFADFGANTYQIRQTAVLSRDDERKRLLTGSLILRTGFGILGLITLIVLAQILGRDETTTWLILLLGAGMFFNNISSSFTQTLIGLESFKLYGLIAIFSQTINIGAACLLIYSGFELLGIGYAYSGWGLLSFFIIAAVFIRKHYSPAPFVSREGVLKFLRGAFPIGLTVILVSLYYKSDYIILGHFRDAAEVGFYNAAYVIVNAMIFIPATLSTTVLPRLSYLSEHDKINLEIIYQRIFKYLFFAGFGLGFGTLAVSSDLIASIYPGEFAASYQALDILIWALALIFINSMQGNMLVALGRQKLLAYITGAAAFVNIGLNLLVIPRYGMQGAAFTTVLAEITAGASCLYILRNYNGVVNILPIAIRTLVAGISMYVLLQIAGDVSLFLRIPSGIVIYFSALYAIRGLNKADFQTLREIFKHGR